MHQTHPPLGVIEGFFGRDWGWAARAQMMSFLASIGFDAYIYAPKSQRALRMDWREALPDADMQALAQLRAEARAHGIAFGVGLTPYGFSAPDWAAETVALTAKLNQIAQLGPDILCLLFDDTPGGDDGLADLHLRITDQVVGAQIAPRLMLCPAYYSDDPILDQVFGPRPAGYLQALGQGLPPEVQVFWTGPKVVSDRYPAAHLAEVAACLQRRPVIWDNACVNDSRALSPFLPLDPDWPALDPSLVAGRMVNPINQPQLARLTLARLARGGTFRSAAADWAGPDLAALLTDDLPVFTQVGHDALTPTQIADLTRRYRPFQAHPMAQEVLEWLDGAYVFDPACLT